MSIPYGKNISITNGSPVIVFEAWSPIGCPEQSLKGTRQVDKAVTHQEEHRQDGGNVIQVANQDAHLTYTYIKTSKELK